jgi:hypothetical protein
MGQKTCRLLLRLYDHRYDRTAMLYNNIPLALDEA